MDLCLSSCVAGRSLHIAAWDMHTGVIHRVYSCDCGSAEDLSSAQGGGACLCLLGRDHILCSVPSLPLIYVWSVFKEQVELKIACPGVVLALAGSPDGVHCAAAISEKVHIWEVCSGHLLAVASLHYQPVRVLQFTDDGVHLLSGGDDCRVVVWRMARLLSDAFDSSGRCLPYAKQALTSLTTGTPLKRHVWSDHSQGVTSLYCGGGGLETRVVTASLDQTCKIYELSSCSLLCSILFDFGLTYVTMDTSERFLFVGGFNGAISRVNLFAHLSSNKSQALLSANRNENSHQSHFVGHNTTITGLTTDNQSVQLASSCRGDVVRVWDIASHQSIRLVKMKGPVLSILKPGVDFSLTKPPTPRPTWLASSSSVQSFKKQPHFKKTNEHVNKALALQKRVMDPLCELHTRPLESLECGYYLPTVSKHSTEILTDHKLTQELAQVKKVNKKLYKFMMEKLLEESTDSKV